MPRTFWIIFLSAAFFKVSYGVLSDEIEGRHVKITSSDRQHGGGNFREIYDKLEKMLKPEKPAGYRAEDEFKKETESQLPNESNGLLVRKKRSLRGGSVLMRRKRAKQQVKRSAINFADMLSMTAVSQTNNAFTPRHEMLGKRDVKQAIAPNDDVPTNMENGDRKRSFFLANLLFMQTEKMPQPLDTLFTDSFM